MIDIGNWFDRWLLAAIAVAQKQKENERVNMNILNLLKIFTIIVLAVFFCVALTLTPVFKRWHSNQIYERVREAFEHPKARYWLCEKRSTVDEIIGFLQGKTDPLDKDIELIKELKRMGYKPCITWTK